MRGRAAALFLMLVGALRPVGAGDGVVGLARRAAAVFAVVVVLAGCGVDEPDGSATAAATPSVSYTEVGDGTVLESDWSYGVGRDGDAWCTRLDVGGTTTSRCGDLLPADDDAFGEIGRGPDDYAEAQAIEGFVDDQAVTVWLIGQSGQYRIPAVVLPLDAVEAEGVKAFVGFAQADVTLTHLQAVALNGDVIQTLELP